MKSMNDYLRVNQMAMQTWTACMQTICLRSEMMSTHSPFSPRVINENIKMSTEKIAASFEVYSQLQASTYDIYHGKYDPLSAWENLLMPINKKAVKNAQRLSRQAKKR